MYASRALPRHASRGRDSSLWLARSGPARDRQVPRVLPQGTRLLAAAVGCGWDHQIGGRGMPAMRPNSAFKADGFAAA